MALSDLIQPNLFPEKPKEDEVNRKGKWVILSDGTSNIYIWVEGVHSKEEFIDLAAKQLNSMSDDNIEIHVSDI